MRDARCDGLSRRHFATATLGLLGFRRQRMPPTATATTTRTLALHHRLEVDLPGGHTLRLDPFGAFEQILGTHDTVMRGANSWDDIDWGGVLGDDEYGVVFEADLAPVDETTTAPTADAFAVDIRQGGVARPLQQTADVPWLAVEGEWSPMFWRTDVPLAHGMNEMLAFAVPAGDEPCAIEYADATVSFRLGVTVSQEGEPDA